MAWLNNLKKRLINNECGHAIDLLNLFHRHCPNEFEEWKKTGSTVLLRDSCQRFKDWGVCRNKTRPMPFDNDWMAIDSCWTKPIKKG